MTQSLSDQELKVISLARSIDEKGKIWAEKECEAQRLEELKKTIRSSLAVTFLESDGGSVARAELLAESDKRYQEHINKMVEARKEANVAKVNLDAAKIFVELQRTLESTRRAEMLMR